MVCQCDTTDTFVCAPAANEVYSYNQPFQLKENDNTGWWMIDNDDDTTKLHAANKIDQDKASTIQ